ncbi:MAG TPA: hypothetical protein VMU77_05290, partial [Acidimicrobiales bacterium]|nr:hypothetical protein [Acidimicrobiales bacterium]
SGLTAGSVVANAVAPRVRQRLSEEQILASSMCIVCAASGAAMATGGILTQAILIFVASLSSGIAKVAFDALVQRDTPESRRGTAFARFETRFQLVWVIGAVIPVAFAFPVGWGDGAMAGLSGVAAVAYWTRWQSLKSRAVRKRPPIV